MDNIVFLVLRRMRQPLLTLIVVYAVAVLGLTLIPGQDDQGNLWYMDIFHAFYFVSYTATTIGLGEIPYPFSDGQRLWVTLSLYATVIAWFYAIGTIVALLQNRVFQEALAEHRFARRIRHMGEPFYLICGYGETGSALVRALTERGRHAVVIDIDPERVSLISLDNLREFVPALHGDARRPRHLLEAGLQHDACAGVVAVTNVNEANLKVAITAKLLHPQIKVICRADSHDVEANMRSFGTDHIIDPFDTFALHLATALQAPCLYLLQRWLTGEEGAGLSEPVYPPHDRHWIVCGYGRFGKAVYARLREEGIRIVVIEAHPELTGTPSGDFVAGRGTEAETLQAADVQNAAGIVAGTDNDANNLSIVMTARDLNPDVFVVLRQNHSDNRTIIDAIGADMVMHPSAIIADKIRVLLATPMLYQFISLASYQEDDWACQLVSRISALVDAEVPIIRELTIDARETPAAYTILRQGGKLFLGDVMRDPWLRERNLACIVLLLDRRGGRELLPAPEQTLRLDDKLLVCGDPGNLARLGWNLYHSHALEYVRTGDQRPAGWIWHYIRRWY